MSLASQVGSNNYTSYNISIDPAQVQSSLNGKVVEQIVMDENFEPATHSNRDFYLGITLIALGVIGIFLTPGGIILLGITTAGLISALALGTAIISTGMIGFGGYLVDRNEKALREINKPPSYEQTLLLPPEYHTPYWDQTAAPLEQPLNYSEYDPSIPPPPYSAN